MKASDKHPLVKITRSEALWALGFGTLVGGGLTLFLAYVGTLPIKFSVLLSTIVATILVWRRRVFPFGHLFTNRIQAHLKDPVLQPLATTLEEQKTTYLLHVSLVWWLIQAGVVVVGLLYPSRLTGLLEKGGHIFELLALWPAVQLLTDWIMIGFMASVICVGPSAMVMWLCFHILALRVGSRRKKVTG